MRLIVSAAALNQTPLDWPGNRARILQAIEAARAHGANFLCLPELCITGYGCEDMFLAPHVHERAIASLLAILPATKGMMLNAGLPIAHQGVVYNCAAVIADGKLLGLTAKKNLCGDGVHYEPRWFTPWPAGVRRETKIGDISVPFGDVWYDVNGVGVGYEICHDAWVENRHALDLAPRGITLIANPSASHFAFQKRAIVEGLCQTGSKLVNGVYIFANLLGCEAGRTIYGGDRIVAQNGTITASGERFTFRDVEVTSALVEADARISAAGAVKIQLDIPAARPVHAEISAAQWEKSDTVTLMGAPVPVRKLEEFARAEALGLFDYMRKSHSKGFVVSLSGGADSAALSCLVYLMRVFVERDLGVNKLGEKCSYFPELSEALRTKKEMQTLLCCAYQGSENSSATTRNAAAGISKALGAAFYDLTVGPLIKAYTDLIGAAVQHSFDWKENDLALQNIQARVRSPSIWMIANYRQALLLASSNRSEASVGYATMDGDSSGGLSPLGGIDKAFLRRWLLWLQTTGPAECGPIPALAAVTEQAPTAELRPPGAHQTDEGDLMPYDVLDLLERLAVRDKKSPIAVWNVATSYFSKQFSQQQLGAWVEKFFTLWSASQWKRERYAPSFHLDDESVDPKTWCRFPILSGGFTEELMELRAAVAALR